MGVKGIWSGLCAVWEVVKWLRQVKKDLETDADAYLSDERAARWRLNAELIFKALEDGPANPNFTRLPKIVRWLCGPTRVDNAIGRFGQKFLKSGKLAEGSPVLRETRLHP